MPIDPALDPHHRWSNAASIHRRPHRAVGGAGSTASWRGGSSMRSGVGRRAIDRRDSSTVGSTSCTEASTPSATKPSPSADAGWPPSSPPARAPCSATTPRRALWGIRPTSPHPHRRHRSPDPARDQAPSALTAPFSHEDERTTHDGIPVTTPARTLLDLAASLNLRQLERAINEAEALRLTSPTRHRRTRQRHQPRGTANLRTLLLNARSSTRSELEAEFLAFLDAPQPPDATDEHHH